MNRRQFVKNSGLVAAAAALGLPDLSAKKVGKFGIQLYTLRDIIGKDPKGVLQQLAAFGYKEIESYSGQQGIFWGMSNKEFASYVDSIGMKMVSSHYDWKNDTEKLAPQAAEIGMKYLICPYLGKQKTMDDYKRTADAFNKAGEICKKNGIRFAYHNHGYSFEDAVNGLYPQDVMMQGTDPALVDFEMDIYWVATAGQDPEAWMKKYPNRWKLVHVKDRGKNFPAGQADASVDLGTGILDFSKILKTARKTGVKHCIVEQERYDNTTSIKCAESNAAYMKKLSI